MPWSAGTVFGGYRLVFYPPGTSTADRRLVRLWRGWLVGGALLVFLAVMLLGNTVSSPNAVLAVAVGAYVCIGALLFMPGRTRPRASQVHVSHPHAWNRRDAHA